MRVTIEVGDQKYCEGGTSFLSNVTHQIPESYSGAQHLPTTKEDTRNSCNSSFMQNANTLLIHIGWFKWPISKIRVS